MLPLLPDDPLVPDDDPLVPEPVEPEGVEPLLVPDDPEVDEPLLVPVPVDPLLLLPGAPIALLFVFVSDDELLPLPYVLELVLLRFIVLDDELLDP